MVRRLAICAAFATWCFLDTWVEFAEGTSAYFSRHDPVRAVAIPVLACQLVLTVGMFAVWELFRKRRLTRRTGVHLLFLSSCLVPLGIAAVAAVRASPVNLIPAIQTHWFWLVVLGAVAAPLSFVFLRPFAASHLMRGMLLWSWPVLAFVLFQAGRKTLLRYPAASYRDRPPAPPLPNPPRDVRVVWIIFDETSQEIAFGNRPPNRPAATGPCPAPRPALTADRWLEPPIRVQRASAPNSPLLPGPSHASIYSAY